MDLTTSEQDVMDRFAHKTHIAGGPKAGYVLRRQALVSSAEAEVDGGIASLAERGLLTVGESGDFVYLTEAGVEALAGGPA